jgi:hypothetical protein
MVSPHSVASYLASGHTVAQAARRFKVSERHVSRLKASAAAPPVSTSRPSISRYIPRPADEVAKPNAMWRGADGVLHPVRTGTTGAAWNALQLRGVPLPICQVAVPVAVRDVPDTAPLFEALQSPIPDVSSSDTLPPVVSDPAPLVADVPPAAPVSSLHKDEAPPTAVVAPVVLPRLRASSIACDLGSWLWEHRPVLQLVIGLVVVVLLVALGVI